MSPTKSQLTSLALRKKLLLAESEVNREQVLADCQSLAGEMRGLVGQAKAVYSTIAAAASVGIAGIKAFEEARETYASGKAPGYQG